MCLFPKILKNPKYKANKKNRGVVPPVKDKRVLWVPVGCGKCMECMKQKARGWQARLHEEIQDWKQGEKHFVTLTFNTESLIQLRKEITDPLSGYELDNEIVTLAVRRFLERWRAKYGKSIKHWFITELGHQQTEHVHIHGILFTKKTQKRYSKNTGREYEEDITASEIKAIWGYGYTFTGTYVNEATVNYVIKYCMKIDLQHKHYTPKILCSKGIGARYKNQHNAKLNKFNKHGETRETYVLRSGRKINLPMYYRNHIYNDEEKEKLWIQKLDKQERWVDGCKVSLKDGYDDYAKLLAWKQEKNNRLGYTNPNNYDQKQYEHEHRIKLQKRYTNEDQGFEAWCQKLYQR